MKPLDRPELEAEPIAKFTRLAEMMSAAKDPWCLIGGSALVLWGVPGVRVRDIDVLLSQRDALAILSAEGIAVLPPSKSDRFRSRVYAQYGTGIEYDFMAGFEVNGPDGWVGVPPKPEFSMEFGGHAILLPSREELAGILRLFGREKDLDRLKVLEQQITR
jgi:hypothetical protein